MLHRMALRVLPSLSLAVTEDSVRKQKRIVMFVPGLVAFVVYRLTKLLLPLSEPLVLLMVSGLVALVTALLPIVSVAPLRGGGFSKRMGAVC